MRYLNKLTNTFEDWHLFHKAASDQYTLEEEFVEYTYFMFVGDNRMEELRLQEKELEM